MNENINLCEILKDCPKGAEFWHSVHGKVNLVSIDNDVTFPIYLKLYDNNIETCRLAKDGHFLEGVGDCLLWPSKDVRTWVGWKCPKPKFDPKTLKVFKEVLVRDGNGTWEIDIFGYIDDDGWAICLKHGYTQCVPINDETKNLFDTRDEAPDYYRYWED